MTSRATIRLVCPDCKDEFWLRPNQYNAGHRRLRTRCGGCRLARRRRQGAARSRKWRQRHRNAGTA